jgi:putative peptidoglycan lipid II flippase
MTLISRVLGFIREMVAAHFFGASAGMDAYIVASKIPNFMRRLFAEGAFAQAFVPMISEYKTKRSHEEVQVFVNRVAGCLGSVLLLVTAFGMVLAPVLVFIFAPGFMSGDESRLVMASSMLRITFPYLLFISLTAFAGGILNSYGRFAVPAFTPVFLNIMTILSTVFLSSYLVQPVTALAWGMCLGGVVQLLFQWPFLKQIRLVPIPKMNWQDPGVRRILLLMVPALFGVSINQLNLMLSSVFASFLPTASISWLYYAERLMEFPLGGFGVALATVVLPKLAQQHTKSEHNGFSETLDWGLRWVLLIGMPAALGLALLAGPLLTTLFFSETGRFTEYDVWMSRQALIAYSVGIMGFMLVKILASAYYARQDIKTPVRFAVITVIANIILSLLLIMPLAHAGLALATSLAALLNASLLGIGLYKRKLYQIQKGWKMFISRLLLACLMMSMVLWFFSPPIEYWVASEAIKRVGMLTALVMGAGCMYILTLWVFGLRLKHVLTETVQVKIIEEVEQK